MSLYKKEYFIDYTTLRNNLKEDSNYGIYIINTAKVTNSGEEYDAISIGNPAADAVEAALNINIGTSKEPRFINIPPTWIPVNLAEYGEADEIIKSSDFKNMCEARYVMLINKEGYETIMADPDAKATKDYLSGLRFNTVARATDDDLIDSLNKKVVKKEPVAKKEVTKKDKATSITPVVYELTNKDSDLSHSTIFQKYKALEPKLTKADLNYIIKNSDIKKLQKAAEDRLTYL